MSLSNREEWKPADVDIASKVWDSLSPLARRIYSLLLASDSGMTTEDLAAKLETGVTQVLGAFGAPALFCKSHNREPIQRKALDNSWFIPPKAKKLFSQVAASDPVKGPIQGELYKTPRRTVEQCPYCGQPWKNGSFPVGWDGHAEFICRGVAHLPQSERKSAFKAMMIQDGHC